MVVNRHTAVENIPAVFRAVCAEYVSVCFGSIDVTLEIHIASHAYRNIVVGNEVDTVCSVIDAYHFLDDTDIAIAAKCQFGRGDSVSAEYVYKGHIAAREYYVDVVAEIDALIEFEVYIILIRIEFYGVTVEGYAEIELCALLEFNDFVDSVDCHNVGSVINIDCRHYIHGLGYLVIIYAFAQFGLSQKRLGSRPLLRSDFLFFPNRREEIVCPKIKTLVAFEMNCLRTDECGKLFIHMREHIIVGAIEIRAGIARRESESSQPGTYYGRI